MCVSLGEAASSWESRLSYSPRLFAVPMATLQRGQDCRRRSQGGYYDGGSGAQDWSSGAVWAGIVKGQSLEAS